MKNCFWKSKGKISAIAIIVCAALALAACTDLFDTTDNKPLNINSTDNANCYIVDPGANFSFNATKQGNSDDDIVGLAMAAKAVVLWESYGTSTAPKAGAIVNNVAYDSSAGKISLKAGADGNAVVALEDGDGNILWSWHIWVTDYDPNIGYNKYEGKDKFPMMDRNLGALSATPGDLGALGLLYQWGRKDPFLGSASISSVSSAAVAASVGAIWPAATTTDAEKGTASYAVANPMTFVCADQAQDTKDWCFKADDNLWASSKSKYDPCPPGWRVPDGGNGGIWSSFPKSNAWDGARHGMSFGKDYSKPEVWYPAAGCRDNYSGRLNDAGGFGSYWTCTPSSNLAYILNFNSDGEVTPTDAGSRALGRSVRCQVE